MNIEIIGLGFQNKGGQLMLCAISRYFAEHLPDVHPVVQWTAGGIRERMQYGLCQKMDTRFIGRTGLLFDVLTPKAIRQHYGLFREDDIDAVLDCSGFVYSDQWPAELTVQRANDFAKWKKQGKKLVMLPQAFGPFEHDNIRHSFQTILQNADLVFARDEASYHHARGVGGTTQHVRMAPDFTNLLDGAVPAYFDTTVRRACIVPSKRMLDKTEPAVRNRYLDFLAWCFRYFEQAELNPFLLRHEIWDDEVSDLLEQHLDQSLEIVQEKDPVLLKGILGSSFLVISSRYHALVSALSQGVPCLGTGWSHKYAALFQDYGCPEHLVHPLATDEQLEKRLCTLIEEPSRSRIIKRLEEAAAVQKEAAQRMWIQVQEALLS